MSSKRRKTRNNNFYADLPSRKSATKHFKQIPSLNPTGNSLPVTNSKCVKKVARLLVALLIIAIISVIVISFTNLF